MLTPSRPVESDVLRSSSPDNPRAWLPPSETQLALEAQLAKAVKAFIDQAKITRDGATSPDEAAQTKLLEEITDLLSEAIHEGRRVATGLDERSMISAVKNVAGRAVQLVGDITEQLTEKAQDLLDEIFADDEDIDPDEALAEVEDELDEWAADYSDMVAQTEISAAVEGAVLMVGVELGATLKYWNAEPGACEKCIENMEASPVGINEAWPNAMSTPGHPRCRCNTTVNAGTLTVAAGTKSSDVSTN